MADLFCGAGGLSEGFRSAGCTILAGADQDPDACATYASNFQEAVTICGDIRAPGTRARFLSAAAGAHVLIGGPPCQAFSQVRNHDRLLQDPRNSLYREFVGALGQILPSAFVMENVPGMDQMGFKTQVLEDLSLDGEFLVRAHLLDAANFGVPQTRKRLVFVGLRRSLGISLPVWEGTGATSCIGLSRRTREGEAYYEVGANDSLFGSWLLERLSDPSDIGIVSSRQALSDLGYLTPGCPAEIPIDALPPPTSEYQSRLRDGTKTICNVDVPRINPDTLLRLAGIPGGGNHRDLSDALKTRYLTDKLWGPNNGTGRLGRRHYYAYRRLHADIWSWTLNTKADSIYHYEALRALSVREFARLQSFPDRFRFTTDPRLGDLPGRLVGGCGHSRYRQVGNAVPPLLARAIAEPLRRILRSRSRKSA